MIRESSFRKRSTRFNVEVIREAYVSRAAIFLILNVAKEDGHDSHETADPVRARLRHAVLYSAVRCGAGHQGEERAESRRREDGAARYQHGVEGRADDALRNR